MTRGTNLDNFVWAYFPHILYRPTVYQGGEICHYYINTIICIINSRVSRLHIWYIVQFNITGSRVTSTFNNSTSRLYVSCNVKLTTSICVYVWRWAEIHASKLICISPWWHAAVCPIPWATYEMMTRCSMFYTVSYIRHDDTLDYVLYRELYEYTQTQDKKYWLRIFPLERKNKSDETLSTAD